jgi:hypothetical protein
VHARGLLYLYCPWAADSTAPVLVVPASWPPEPEEPPGAGDETEGADPLVPDAGGPGDADAGADTEAGSADADADADAVAEADTDGEAGTYPPPARSTDGMP